jgi:hypothetical protein
MFNQSRIDTSSCKKLYQLFDTVCGNDKLFLAKKKYAMVTTFSGTTVFIYENYGQYCLMGLPLQPLDRTYPTGQIWIQTYLYSYVMDLYRSTLIHLKSTFNHTKAMLAFAKYADMQLWICDFVFINTKLVINSVGMRDKFSTSHHV